MGKTLKQLQQWKEKNPSVAKEIAEAVAVAEIDPAKLVQEAVDERMPYRQSRHWMEGLFESKPVKFFINGRPLAKFSYDPRTKTFVSNNTMNQKCIQIKIQRNSVYLADYFYNSGNMMYECEMKPRTMEEHDRFLSTFLDFIAYAFNKSIITLIDGSFKRTGSCTIPHSVFLVAGKQPFYERFGFQNDTQRRFDSAIVITQNMIKDGRTFEDIATDILAQCARNVNQEEDIQMIDAAFKTTLRQESGSMEFHKAGGQRPYRVCVTDGNVYRNVYISEPRQSRRLRR